MYTNNRDVNESFRNVVLSGASLAIAALAPEQGAGQAPLRKTASTKTTRDRVDTYYRDWSKGQPIVFSDGGVLSAGSRESHLLHMANNGFRTIAHNCRGHGCSSKPWDGYDMAHYAYELLDLKDAIRVGFSTGDGEVARYVSRHGTRRVAKLVLVSAVPPLVPTTPDNAFGLPLETFDGIHAGRVNNLSQLYINIPAGPFRGCNRPAAKLSQGLVQSWWAQDIMGGHKNTYDSIKAFSETDFRVDLAKFDEATSIIHGDDDQIVPIYAASRASAKIVKGLKLIVYPSVPDGLTDTHKDKVNADQLAFAHTLSTTTERKTT